MSWLLKPKPDVAKLNRTRSVSAIASDVLSHSTLGGEGEEIDVSHYVTTQNH
jgi:hypothetical protein